MRWCGFDWDEGNRGKNWILHQVSDDEAEEIFLTKPKVFRKGGRFLAYGQTEAGRYLFVVFELRSGCIRIISAREMTEKERRLFRRK